MRLPRSVGSLGPRSIPPSAVCTGPPVAAGRRAPPSGQVALSHEPRVYFAVPREIRLRTGEARPGEGRVLLTIPAHNEEGILYESVYRIIDGLKGTGLDYRLAIAEDGSTDGTGQEIDRLQAEIPGLTVQRLPTRVGRGLALRSLWSSVDAEVYAFMDADLPAEPAALVDVVHAIDDGADVATGSRYCIGAEVHRPPVRSLTSLAYNGLVRFLFQEPIRDHQCGIKAFRREALRVLLPASHEDSWAWDTEILLLALRMRFQVAEVPVVWTERRYRRTPLHRLGSDIRLHGTSLIRLRSDIVERVRAADAADSAHRELPMPVARSRESPIPAPYGPAPTTMD
jgi:glycosyltransferase involved in cell wall biosynthesis